MKTKIIIGLFLMTGTGWVFGQEPVKTLIRKEKSEKLIQKNEVIELKDTRNVIVPDSATSGENKTTFGGAIVREIIKEREITTEIYEATLREVIPVPKAEVIMEKPADPVAESTQIAGTDVKGPIKGNYISNNLPFTVTYNSRPITVVDGLNDRTEQTGTGDRDARVIQNDQVIQLTAYAPGPDQPQRKLKTSAPDLIPYKPSGWSDKIVVSKTTGTNTDDLPLYPTDILYVDWAVLNQGNLVTAGSFHIGLEVDGVRIAAWTFGNLNTNTYTWAVDRIVGPLTAGTHTLKLVADYLNEITESNESNNEYTRTITISPPPPDLIPHKPSDWSDKIVVSKASGTHTDDSPLYSNDNLYIDWAVLNQGTAATAARFYSVLYIDGTLKKTWYTDPPLNPGSYSSASDYSPGSLTAGTHTVKIVIDNTGTVAESSETNNEYTKTITVLSTQPDLTPYKPSGWADKIVVSKSAATHTDDTPLYPTDNIYIDWAVLNDGITATTALFHIALYVDGTLNKTWYNNPPLNPTYFTYLSDYSLGNLAAGNHTIKIVADYQNEVAESIETNNEYTKTITISPPPPDLVPYKPGAWSDKIVVSKTTGTNTDDSPLYPTDVLYVDWAVINQGNSATAAATHIGLEVDGVRIAAWIAGAPLNPNTYTWAVDRIVGPLAAGTHTLKIVADYLNEVPESDETNNEYTRTITITAGLPDLIPYQPTGWSDKIVVSRSIGTHTDDSPLYPTDNLYVDWSVGNQGGTATAARFYTTLYVDGTLKNTWYTDPPLNADAFSFAADYNIGKLAEGNHTIKIVFDNTGTVSESNETNNEYTKTITISQSPPDLTPFKPNGWSDFIVASIVTGTTTDAVTIYPTDNIYLDWAVVNLGGSATTARFYIALYVDGILKASTYKDPPLNGRSYVSMSDYILGVLAAGTHTIRIVADDTRTIAESDETNNEYTRTITVVQNNLPDLTFYKPASWSDKIVVSTVPGTNKDAAIIYPTDFLYIDWVVTNQGTAATAARYSTTLYIEGIMNTRFITDPPVNANSIHYYVDFGLGNLPAGTYTMRMVIDVDGTIAESDETNNEYSRTLIVSSGSSNHFTPVWSGTFYRPMTIVVKQAELAGTALAAGDEIGVYDGSMCVGMGKLSQSINPSTPGTHLYITVSKNEGSGNGYTEGNTITYRMWDSSLNREPETVTGVYPGPPFNSSVFKVGEKTIVELTGRWTYEQQIRLVSGWNLVSSAVIPDPKSMRDVMNNLIDGNLLYKVIDEKGNMLQKMSWGWDNSIGDIAPTEGYYVNVTGNCDLSVTGATVQMPFSIPLRTGWNLMGYPSLISRDAQTFFSSIIGSGDLYKVFDDQGNILQRMPWGWVNTIGNLQAGEGYCIKVLRDVTVQFTSSPVFPGGGGYKTGDLGSPGTCFKTAHAGNPYKPVHLILTGLESLDPGDEVGVFQGNLCVGSGLYSGQDRLILVASADDPGTGETDGYIDGGEFEFRIWRSATGREFTGFEVADEVGTKQFKEMDTYAGKLQVITDPESLFPYLEQNFPNPATQSTSIVYGIPQTGHVSIRLFDLSGKQIQSLIDQEQTKGRYRVDYSTSGLRQGIYYYRFEFTADRKTSQITRNMVITN